MNGVALSKIEKVNNLHGVLEYELRTSVKKAIEIGGLLSEIREGCEHGEWEPLFGAKIKFSVAIAKRYITISEHSDKTLKCSDLQSAYEEARQIESDERKKEQEERQNLINKRKQTGEKPEGWTRAHEYEYKKQVDEEAYTERKSDAFKPKEKEKQKETESDYEFDKAFNDTMDWLRKMTDKSQGLSGKVDIIFIIDKYLVELENDSRRHEFCNTLIKHLRTKSIEYSRCAQ